MSNENVASARFYLPKTLSSHSWQTLFPDGAKGWPCLTTVGESDTDRERLAFTNFAAKLGHGADTGMGAGGDPVSMAIGATVANWSAAVRLDEKALRKGHRKLMNGERAAGEFRRGGVCQVRCVRSGAVIYTPPPASRLNVLVDDLMTFIATGPVPSLAKAFIVMLQLLLIHPFADGNGRCARVLFAAICARGGCDHPIALLALARLYGGGSTRLHAGSATLRATGDWSAYLDACSRSIVEATALWRDYIASRDESDEGPVRADQGLDRLWLRAMSG